MDTALKHPVPDRVKQSFVIFDIQAQQPALPALTAIIQTRRLTLFGHLVRMDESADARRILTAVSQSEWRRPVGRPYTSWMATLKNDLALHTTLPWRTLLNWL